MRLVLLNGPPGCGKDTAGRALADQCGAVVVKLAHALKSATHAIYGVTAGVGAFEGAAKEAPSPLFFGLSPRQAYIKVSEELVKPFLGADHFGHVLARRLEKLRAAGVGIVAVTDSGFIEEAAPLVKCVGAGNALLLRIHAEGRGRTFAGDSRSHISLPGVTTLDVHNDGAEADFCRDVAALVLGWITADDELRMSTTAPLESIGA